jgi:hypothetical protein
MHLDSKSTSSQTSSRAGLGENGTGVTNAFYEVSPRTLEVFLALIPTLQQVLVPYDADDSGLVEPLQVLRRTA